MKAPQFLFQEDGSNISLDLKLAAAKTMSCSLATDFPVSSFFNESRNAKRLKQEPGDYSTYSSPAGVRFRDHVSAYAQKYMAVEAMAEAATMMRDRDRETEETEPCRDGMRLVQQLMACAEAVACRDKTFGSALLSELRANALVFGSSFQRVASCFVQGLYERLHMVQPLGTLGALGANEDKLTSDPTAEKDKALGLAYEVCPLIKFGHFAANAAILEAFEGESLVHVVDLGMSLGLSGGPQWQGLIDSLAHRKLPPRLRITGVGNSSDHLRAIGRDLELYARTRGLEFEFLIVESNVETLKPEQIEVLDGEVLVINSIFELHCVVKESRGALNSVLQALHELSPKLLVVVEQDSSHNGPFFLGRFMEALHYYAAIFDSLDAMLPKYDTRRAKVEQFYFGEEIRNIVSCEGDARVERHERVEQWRRRMSRAGFQAAASRRAVLGQAVEWMGKEKVCGGYTVVEEKGCLVLGWKGKPIVAASRWKCP